MVRGLISRDALLPLLFCRTAVLQRKSQAVNLFNFINEEQWLIKVDTGFDVSPATTFTTVCEVLWNSCGKSGSDSGLLRQCSLDCQRNDGPDNHMCELDKEFAVNGREAKSAVLI